MKRFIVFVTPTGLETWIDTDKIVAVTFPCKKFPEGESNYCFVFVGPGEHDSFTIALPSGWDSSSFMKFISSGSGSCI